MNFLEYDQLHERCELYKINAVKGILNITGNSLDIEIAVMYKCYIYRCGEDTLRYHIHLADGYNLDGDMSISILDMYLSGDVVEAKLKYKEQNSEQKSR